MYICANVRMYKPLRWMWGKQLKNYKFKNKFYLNWLKLTQTFGIIFYYLLHIIMKLFFVKGALIFRSCPQAVNTATCCC